MHNYQATIKKFLWIGLAAAILMGCGAKPSEFKPTAGEMKEGPGVFTGKEGEFAIYDSKKGGPFWKHSKEEAGKEAATTSDKTSEVSQIQIAADDKSKEAQVTPEAAREFQEFQEWKKEQKEFEEFQEWKKTSKGAAEYKEFLEWKEWKSYQEWKKQQRQ
jgi:adenylosuccinate synthase